MGFLQRLVIAGTAAMLLAAGSAAISTQPSPVAPAQQSAHPQPHSEDAYSLPPEKLAQAVVLNRIRVALDIGGSLWGLVVLWWLLASGRAARMSDWTRELTRWGWLQGLVFFAALIVILTLAGWALDAAAHAASRHYGISVQGWGGWLGDQSKGLALALVIGAPLGLFFNWIVRKSPRSYWLWMWLCSLPLILASVFLEPLVIDPLFNKFEPLEQANPALAAKLEEVVARTGVQIPESRMFLMKASEKTNGVNAYVTGVGSSKRFVMWDTTTDRMPADEIMFIFGHESGHYVLNHIPKMLAISMGAMFFVFWVCASLAEGMVRRFGERWGVHAVSERAGFVTLVLAFSIAGFVLTPAGNAISRHYEHEADVYGQEAIHGLVADSQKTAVSSFNHLGEAWLDDPNPNGLVEFWSYSHPSVQHRAQFAERYDPWTDGGRGKFFSR